MPIAEYDVHGLTKDLVKIMRIQDWDIRVSLCDSLDMLKSGYDANTMGLCTKDRPHKDALIQLNTDHPNNIEVYERDDNGGWLYTLIHELNHIVIDNLVENVEYTFEFLDEKIFTTLNNSFNLKQETLVNMITKIMLNLIPVGELVSKYRKEDVHDATKKDE